MGWIKADQIAGRRRIGSTSIPQYITAVTQIHLMVLGVRLPKYLFFEFVRSSYIKWEGANFPNAEILSGLSAEIIRRVFTHWMSATDPGVARDCALLVLCFAFNGLRESSVIILRHDKAWFQGRNLFARCSVWRGQEVSRQQVVSFCPHDGGRPLDIFERYFRHRLRMELFWAIQYDESLKSGMINDALD